MREVYLDYAASAPASKNANDALKLALKEQKGNPGSPHAAGLRAKRVLEDARTRIARIASVKPDGVIFTSGATEANNLAIRGHVEALRMQGHALSKMHLLYIPTAHASVVETIGALAKEGVQVEPIALSDGAINLQALKKQIRSETVLASVDVICGETGTRWAVRDVRRVIDEVQREKNDARNLSRTVLHTDASQAPFVESIEHTHLGADLITLDAQKIGGVRGTGALVRASARIPLAPIMHGGGQEFGLRPGTENPALASAFATALEDANEARIHAHAKNVAARDNLLSYIIRECPDVLVNAGIHSSPYILNISFPNRDTDYAVMLLSERGYYVSTKSACETNEEGSRAVQAMFDDTARARSTLRISWGPSTSNKDLEHFAQELVKVVKFLDKTSLNN